MNGGHLSSTVLTVLLVVGAGILYGAVVLYGAWIDGRRQSVREQGLTPVTEPTGGVHGLPPQGEEENDKWQQP